jgi:hypothetical protein
MKDLSSRELRRKFANSSPGLQQPWVHIAAEHINAEGVREAAATARLQFTIE